MPSIPFEGGGWTVQPFPKRRISDSFGITSSAMGKPRKMDRFQGVSKNPIKELAQPLGEINIIFQSKICAILLEAKECLRQEWRGRTIQIYSISRFAS